MFGQHRCRNRFGCFFFELSQRRCDQDTDVTVAQDQDLALIQPAPSEYEQLIPIGAAGHLIAQGAYQGATLVLRHPMKPQDITGQLLMVKEGSTANIQGSQGCQFNSSDADFVTQMAPQGCRNDAHRIQQAPAQAQETYVQCQTQLVGVASAGVDELALSTAVREKRLKLEGADFPWQLSQAKVGCVPALHLVSPVIGADTIRLKK